MCIFGSWIVGQLVNLSVCLSCALPERPKNALSIESVSLNQRLVGLIELLPRRGRWRWCHRINRHHDVAVGPAVAPDGAAAKEPAACSEVPTTHVHAGKAFVELRLHICIACISQTFHSFCDIWMCAPECLRTVGYSGASCTSTMPSRVERTECSRTSIRGT